MGVVLIVIFPFREGAIDRLIRLYKQVVPQTHGYLTHNGTVNLHRVQMMMTGEKNFTSDQNFTGHPIKFPEHSFRGSVEHLHSSIVIDQPLK